MTIIELTETDAVLSWFTCDSSLF